MPRVLTNGKVKIGAFMFPDRKKPMLCKQKGNEIVAYGSFRSIEAANHFMEALGKLVQAEFDDGGLEHEDH